MVGRAIGKQTILMLLLALLALLPAGCGKVDDTGKTLYFRGESENWRGLVVNRYQEAWSKDENGRLRYSNTVREELFLKYKSTDKDIGHLRWEYKSRAGGGASGEENSPKPDRFGYISCGGRGGQNVWLTRAGDSYTLTVEWDGGKKETFELITSEKGLSHRAAPRTFAAGAAAPATSARSAALLIQLSVGFQGPSLRCDPGPGGT